jgi:hypothetical protein
MSFFAGIKWLGNKEPDHLKVGIEFFHFENFCIGDQNKQKKRVHSPNCLRKFGRVGIFKSYVPSLPNCNFGETTFRYTGFRKTFGRLNCSENDLSDKRRSRAAK